MDYRLKAEDANEVNRIYGYFVERDEWDVDGYVRKQLAGYKAYVIKFREQPRAEGTLEYTLASVFFRMQMHFFDTGIIERYRNNDIGRMRSCLSLSARCGYLTRVSGGKEFSGGCDCQHVYDMITAAACGDWSALDRFPTAFTGPARTGHKSTVTLCNGLYVALRFLHDRNAEVIAALQGEEKSRYFRGLFDAQLGIIAGSASETQQGLNAVLKLHKKQGSRHLEKVFCHHVHALYAIWRRNGGADFSADMTQYRWDHEVDHAVAGNQEIVRLDFNGINPVFARWIDQLPDGIDEEELLQHIVV